MTYLYIPFERETFAPKPMTPEEILEKARVDKDFNPLKAAKDSSVGETSLEIMAENHVAAAEAGVIAEAFKKKGVTFANVDELDQAVDSLSDEEWAEVKRQIEQKAPCICIQGDRDSMEKLKSAGKDDTVYVMAHGHGGEAWLSSTDHSFEGTSAGIDAKTLLKQMQAAGLNPEIGKVKIYACGSGSNKAGVIDPMKTFAGAFFQATQAEKNQHFKNSEITGYDLGIVFSSHPDNLIADEKLRPKTGLRPAPADEFSLISGEIGQIDAQKAQLALELVAKRGERSMLRKEYKSEIRKDPSSSGAMSTREALDQARKEVRDLKREVRHLNRELDPAREKLDEKSNEILDAHTVRASEAGIHFSRDQDGGASISHGRARRQG